MTSRKRTRSRAWFFTWDNAEDCNVAQICKIFDDLEVKYVFQKERSESGMIHLQGVIRFENPRDNVGNLFNMCHWERCRSWRKAIKYCSKLDTRIEGPWSNIRDLKYRETIIDPLLGKDLWAWQRHCIQIVDSIVDDRVVHWFWDKIGGGGKTSLCKHIILKYGSRAIYFNGGSKDILYALGTRLEENNCKIALFNLSRQDANRVSYKSIETLKDGICFSSKYESRQLVFNPMHVLVFANFPPERELLSEDRWKIMRI